MCTQAVNLLVAFKLSEETKSVNSLIALFFSEAPISRAVSQPLERRESIRSVSEASEDGAQVNYVKHDSVQIRRGNRDN